MIYTSNFAKSRLLDINRCLSISVGTPLWFNGKSFGELKPTWDMVMDHKKGKITNEEYIKLFYENVLNKLDREKIIKELDNKILLCWCGKDKFCHRHIVENWLNDFEKNSCAEIDK